MHEYAREEVGAGEHRTRLYGRAAGTRPRSTRNVLPMRLHRFASDRLFSRIDQRLVSPVRHEVGALDGEVVTIRAQVAAMRTEIAEMRTGLEALQRDLADLTTILADASALARARARAADEAQPARERGE